MGTDSPNQTGQDSREQTGQDRPPGTALGPLLPPWPLELSVGEASARLGISREALRKRVARRQQPGHRRGREAYVTLLPAQWADYARGYQPPERAASAESAAPTAPGAPTATADPAQAVLSGLVGVESPVHQQAAPDGTTPGPAQGPAPAAAERPATGPEAVLVLLGQLGQAQHQLGQAERRIEALAGQLGYWQGQAVEAQGENQKLLELLQARLEAPPAAPQLMAPAPALAPPPPPPAPLSGWQRFLLRLAGLAAAPAAPPPASSPRPGRDPG